MPQGGRSPVSALGRADQSPGPRGRVESEGGCARAGESQAEVGYVMRTGILDLGNGRGRGTHGWVRGFMIGDIKEITQMHGGKDGA